MKKIFILLAFFIYSNQINAQGFYSLADSINLLYPNDTIEGGPKEQVERIKRKWHGQYDKNGQFGQAAHNFYTFSQGYKNFRKATSSCGSFIPVWKEIGPSMETNNPGGLSGGGQINRMTFHPAYNGTGTGSNEQTIFGLSAWGGIWKSIDNGDNWVRLNTDNDIPFSSFGTLVIDPINTNRMYVTTGHPSGEAPFGNYPYFTLGVYGTDDGGVTWQQINNGLITSNLFNSGTIFNMQIDPSNHANLIFTSTDGVFYSTNADQLVVNNVSWTKDPNFTFPDTKIVGLTYNPSTLEWFVSGKNIYATPNPFLAGHTWSNITGAGSSFDISSGFYPASTENIFSIKVMNSPFYPSDVFALVFSGAPSTNGYITILKLSGLSASNSIQNITHKYSNAQDGITHYGMMAFVVSPNPGEFYYGSTDYGHYSIFTNILGESYGNCGIGCHHADVHSLYIHPSQPTRLWLCGDGGISTADVIQNIHNPRGFTFKNKGIQS